MASDLINVYETSADHTLKDTLSPNKERDSEV